MSQRRLNALREETNGTLTDIVNLLAEEDDPRAFGGRVLDTLTEAHTDAVVLGRGHAGDRAPLEDDDRRFAQTIVDSETEYLVGFVDDLQDGRYTNENGELDREAIERRLHLYSNRLVGTANEALVLASDLDAMWEWILGVEASHCTDCPEIAAGSPYKAEDLPTTPGQNVTRCLHNCRCQLRRSDGLEAFTL